MQPPQNNSQFQIEQRILAVRILWIALFSSIVIYYLITIFVRPPANSNPNNMLSLVLLVVGLSTILLSFVIKKKFLTQSVAQQRPKLLQQGYIITWAITEVAALLGLLDYFATGHPHYYLLFIIAALGMLLHFPRRQHVLDASFKNATF